MGNGADNIKVVHHALYTLITGRFKHCLSQVWESIAKGHRNRLQAERSLTIQTIAGHQEAMRLLSAIAEDLEMVVSGTENAMDQSSGLFNFCLWDPYIQYYFLLKMNVTRCMEDIFTGAPQIFKGVGGTAQNPAYCARMFGYFQLFVHALAPEARFPEPLFYEHDIALNYKVLV